jgi:integrase
LCRYRVKSSASTERLLLNDEEIKAIFENFDYLNKNLYKTLKTDPLKVYGILLMMYLGIRPIETGQLMVNDLQETKDSEGNTIYYLSVSDENSSDNKFFNETKSQKTDNARRKLPLTDLLIKDFRFLTFVEKRKKDKHNFIFIDDENESTIINEIKNTVRRCEDTFNRYLKKLNLKDSNRKTFYSLRHSFANKIKHIPESLRDKRGESLMGHSRISDSELFNRYGNKYFEPDFLYEILEKIEYSNLDLANIKEIVKKL